MSANVYDLLEERGFIQQVTDEAAVRELLAEPPATVYIGYDPTADSLHVGNLFTLMALAHFERAGHRCLVVAGGGTAMVGDPSGKTELRKMLSEETIAANLERITEQIGRVLDVAGGKSVVINNADWFLKLGYIEFLRDVGRHFSVNRMLAAEAYKQRLERGLSFIELNYQLLQAYDFVQLRREYDCRLQMGGDDQWGNILAGVDLCRRMDGELTQGLTLPLLLNASGEKMGKTAQGAVWLSADRLAPYDYYQYWVNVDDADAARLLGFYTFLPMAEVRAVKKMSGVELNFAKSILAYEATRIIHGAAAAGEAHRAASAAFGGRQIPAAIIPSSEIPRVVAADAEQLPTTELSAAELDAGIPLIELMVRAKLAKSKGEARRLIGQGAVRIGDERVQEQLFAVSTAAPGEDGTFIVRVGKKKLHRFLVA